MKRYLRKLESIVQSDYNHERPDILRSKDFNRTFRNAVKHAIKKYGYTLVPRNYCVYCESSGFVTDNNGHYVYFNSGDYRISAPYCDWKEYVLVRTAASTEDYSGGSNHYCNFVNLGEAIHSLMMRA